MAAALKLAPTSGWHSLDPHDAAQAVERLMPAALQADDPLALLHWWKWQLVAGRFGMVELCTGRNGDPVAGMVYRIDGDALHVVALASYEKTDLDMITAADDAADQLARAYRCTRVRMETVRPGLVRQLERRGWGLRTVEMVRDVRR